MDDNLQPVSNNQSTSDSNVPTDSEDTDNAVQDTGSDDITSVPAATVVTPTAVENPTEGLNDVAEKTSQPNPEDENLKTFTELKDDVEEDTESFMDDTGSY